MTHKLASEFGTELSLPYNRQASYIFAILRQTIPTLYAYQTSLWAAIHLVKMSEDLAHGKLK